MSTPHDWRADLADRLRRLADFVTSPGYKWSAALDKVSAAEWELMRARCVHCGQTRAIKLPAPSFQWRCVNRKGCAARMARGDRRA